MLHCHLRKGFTNSHRAGPTDCHEEEGRKVSDRGYEDAVTLAVAIARVRKALEKGNPDPDTREKLERELAIYMEMWREVDPLKEV